MLELVDTIVIASYVLGVFLVASYVASGKGLDSFFVNRRSTRLSLLILSIVSTTVGAGFFVTVVAETYESGISFGLSIMTVSVVTAIVLASIAPRIKALSDVEKIYTVPELLSHRFGSTAVGRVAAIVVVFGYLFVAALQFVGIGAVASVVGGFEFSDILLVAGISAIAYTTIGGIRSNLYADAISFAVVIVGLVIFVPFLFSDVDKSFASLPSSYFDPFAFAGPSFLALSFVLSGVSAFMFMELWQRIFSAESIETARKGFIWSAFLMPALIASAVLIGLVAATNYDGIDKRDALFLMIGDNLPAGLSGLGVVTLIAILMSTVNSLVVVGGSALYVDVFRQRGVDSKRTNSLALARALTASFGIAALVLAFWMPDLVRLLLMGAFVMLPLCPTIMWAVFSNRCRAKPAIWSIALGMITTFTLMPLLPDTAFGPGFLVSLVTIWVGHYFSNSTKDSVNA